MVSIGGFFIRLYHAIETQLDRLLKTVRTSTLQAQLVDATHACLSRAQPLLFGHGRQLPEVRIDFSQRGRSAGQMRIDAKGTLEIRYNLGMAAAQPEEFLCEVPPHEVAHLVTWLLHGRKARPHGAEWQSVMHHLGIENPRRCHDFQLNGTVRQQRRWAYRCDCREHALSTTRHHRAQQGTQYHCTSCGMRLEPIKDNKR